MNKDGFRFPYEDSSLFVRPITPADRPLIDSSFKELSPESKYLRFFQSAARLNNYQLEYLSHPDGKDHVAWGIVDTSVEPNIGVCAMRFIRLKDNPEVAEAAITVADKYQGQGLSKVAFAVLNILAKEVGIKRFRHHVLHQNSVVNKSLDKLGILGGHVESGVTIKETMVCGTSAEIPDLPQLQGARNTMQFVEFKMRGTIGSSSQETTSANA